MSNYSTTPVPEAETVGCLHLTAVIVAMATSLPAFLLGADIFMALGAVRGTFAALTGCLVLALLAMLTMSIGGVVRLNTYTIIRAVFGDLGGRLVTLLLSLTVFGWFGITATLFGRICERAFNDTLGWSPTESTFIVGGGVLMIATAIFGFRALDLLGRWTVPLMLLVMAASAFLIIEPVGLRVVVDTQAVPSVNIPGMGAAASIVIGSLMVAVAIAPDIARFSRSKGHSIAAAALSYGVGVLLILMLAGLPALATGSNDLVNNMSNSGLGVFALVILVLATWTTNATNLYSASLGMSQWFVARREWQVTLVAGIIGTGLALAGILDYFIDFLVFLSLAIPPVAGIYITHYFLATDGNFTEAGSTQWRPRAFVAWFGGTAIAAALAYGYGTSLTGIPACDATLAAAGIYAALTKILESRSKRLLAKNA